MIQENPNIILFKDQLQSSLLKETLSYRSSKIAKNSNIYNSGDKNDTVYFIERGQVKLVITSPEGKECTLIIHSQGDIFGELSLSGLGGRLETATAMEQTYLKQIPAAKFLMHLNKESLLEGFIQYLTFRIAEQQQVISTLVTVNSEQRLAKTLLHLARSLGKRDPRSILIALKISHEELSSMIGTTRPRISLFMQRFHNLGLIETTKEHFLVIKEHKLTNYLTQIA